MFWAFPAGTHHGDGGLGFILGARRVQVGTEGSLPICGAVRAGQAELQQVGAGKGSLQVVAVLGSAVPAELCDGGTDTWGSDPPEHGQEPPETLPTPP